MLRAVDARAVDARAADVRDTAADARDTAADARVTEAGVAPPRILRVDLRAILTSAYRIFY